MGKFQFYGNSRYQAISFRVVHPRKLKWRVETADIMTVCGTSATLEEALSQLDIEYLLGRIPLSGSRCKLMLLCEQI